MCETPGFRADGLLAFKVLKGILLLCLTLCGLTAAINSLVLDTYNCDFFNLYGINLYQLSLEGCKRECSVRKWCQAVNYFRQEKKCALVRTNGNKTAHNVSVKPCVNIRKEEMENLTTCGCAEHEVCDPVNLTCTVKECLFHGYPPYVQVLGNMYLTHSKLKIKCADNYINVGVDTIRCLPTGNWSHYPQCIRVDCDEPVQHGNANLSSGSVTNGSTRAYVCETGHGIDGSRLATSYKISCFHGTWEYGSSKCSEMGCDEPVIANAILSTGNASHGATRNYTCNAGYSIGDSLENTSATASCSLGNWNYEPCTQIVPTIGQLCLEASDCRETAAMCIRKKCFCDPLYRYNSTIKNCLQVCTAMTSTFTEYKGEWLGDCQTRFCTSGDCDNVCANDPNCLSYNLVHTWQFCFKPVTREMIIDAVPDGLSSYDSSTLFSKKCV